MLYRLNLRLVAEDIACNFASHGSSCWIWLGMQQRDEIWQCQGSEEREVSFHRCEKESVNMRLCDLRMKVGAIGKLGDLFVGKGEDLVNIV